MTDNLRTAEHTQDSGATGAVAHAKMLARTVLTDNAQAVDQDARFPNESLDALRDAGLLAAALPSAHAGLGLSPQKLVDIGVELARGCGSTAMVWAMHQVQISCLARHCGSSADLHNRLNRIGREQRLVASVTSEEGTGGDMRTSNAAVHPPTGTSGSCTLEKRAPTVSYGAEADDFLVTARRTPESPPGDQVAVLLDRDQVRLAAVGTWDTLGMRGTRSVPFHLCAEFGPEQVLPHRFGDIAANTMVPLSHLLWAAVWTGLATEAVDRARRYARQRGSGGDRFLAEAHWRLTGVRAQLTEEARATALLLAGTATATTGLALRSNALKLAASETCLQITQLALRSCGMAGYAERGPYSLARPLRDLHSAPLMIGNERLLTTNADLALLERGEGK